MAALTTDDPDDPRNLRALLLEVVRQMSRHGNSLSVEAWVILLAVIQHAIDYGGLPAQSVLVAILGIGERRLRRGQHELVAAGLIRVRRRGSIPNSVSLERDALAVWVGREDLDSAAEHATSGDIWRSGKTKDLIGQSEGTSAVAPSIPPPAEPTAASRKSAHTVPQPGGQAGGRRGTQRGSGSGHSQQRPDSAHLLPELAEVRRMRSLFSDAGIRLPEALLKILHGWVRDGVPIEDVEYGCVEAARHGSRRFTYVETIVARLKSDRRSEADVAVGEAEHNQLVSFNAYRKGAGR